MSLHPKGLPHIRALLGNGTKHTSATLSSEHQLWRAVEGNLSGWRMLALIALALVVNVLELLGLSLFIPILDLFQGTGGLASTFTRTLSGIVAALSLPPVLSTFLILLSLLFVIKTGFAMWMRYLSVTIASELQDMLRQKLFGALLRSGTSFVNEKRQGVLLSTLSEHTVRTGQAFFTLVQLIAQWLTVAAYAAFVIWVSWKLAIISLLLGFAMTPAIRWIGRQAHRHGKEYTIALEDAQHRALEGLHAKKLVNAMNWAPPLEQRFGTESAAVRQHWQWTAFWANSPGIIIQPISVVVLSAIIWLSLHFGLSVSMLGAFALAFIRMLPAVQGAISMGADFQANRASVDAVFSMLKEAADAKEPSGKQAVPGLRTEICLHDVVYRHGTHKPVLDGLNIEIRKGQTVALIGPSGSGKTTLADLILGLYQPAAGRVTIDGVDLSELDLRQLRARIAYVPQEAMLFHDSIRNNLTLGLDRTVGDDELRAACENVGAWEFIAHRANGLNSIVGDRGLQLSGGQRQRLALARALLRNPEILILDEATSALDNESEEWIKKVLQGLQQSGRFTVILIAHRYTTIQHADQIYEISQGRATPLGDWSQAQGRLQNREMQ